MSIFESHLEEACLAWFADLGYEVLERDHLDPESAFDERRSVEHVILEGRLRIVLAALNPEASEEAIDEVVRRIHRHDAPTLEQNNLDFHRMLTDGVTVEVAGDRGGVRGVRLRLFDFEDPDANDFVVGNQLEVVDRATGSGNLRRPDIVVWINGLPLAVIELKNPASEQADVWGAYNQLQLYKREIPSLFRSNEVLVVSDDVLTRIGSLTADASRFQPWRAVQNEQDMRVPAEVAQTLDHGERLQALIEGVFHKERLLDLVRNFVAFESQQGQIVKKIAGYHQFHAVRRAVEETVRATSESGDKRVGVVWHTQGSGKSLTMVFYAGKLVTHPAMENPTLVVLTDRNDLDDQLFGTFSQSQTLVRQEPVQAKDREHLRELLKTSSGGVYFTTIQKFLPVEGERAPALSERRNVVVIADEAHRSHYERSEKVDPKTGRKRFGLALHLRDALPNASFVGFTGTPLELADKNTVQVFGDYISIYDIRRAVEDGATVPIYYENRLAKIELDEDERPRIDPQFEEVTEGEEDAVKEGLKSEWSTLEALVGSDKRIGLIAADLVAHLEHRNQALKGGKAMVVCMSRRICALLYEAIVKLRPEWHADDDDAGKIKVVMTGGPDDKPALAKHVRTKAQRELLAMRFKDPADQLQLVLVRDMWLTGFDAPCLHTLYVDKPMRGHSLMQAIARVNRVFGDKPGGLVVDYLGIATFLKEAMATYTRSGGQGDATQTNERALEAMQEALEVCRDIFAGFDYALFFSGTAKQRLDLLPAAREHVLKQRIGANGEGKTKTLDGYDRFLATVTKLSRTAAIVAASDEFAAAREEIAFFQAVKAGLVKLSPGRRRPVSDLSQAVRQIVANAIVSDEVIDVFSAAGLDRPDISVLSEEFLAEVQGLPHRNLAAAVLERILRDQIRIRRRESVVQARSFEEMLDEAVRRYLNRSIEASEVIQRLLELAREFRAAGQRAQELGLSREEYAFYEALADNESAKQVLGDNTLAEMAHELTRLVRENASIDWTQKRSVQAKLRTLVKRLLRKYRYPPDGEQAATENVLDQAKLLGINVTSGGSEIEPEPGEWATGTAAATDAARPLPYPIEVFDSLVNSQDSGALRVKTRLDGVERALALIVACEIAWLRERAGGQLAPDVLRIFGELGKPVSMGSWLTYAVAFAKLLPNDSNDPIVRAARALLDDRNAHSALTRELEGEVVPFRNSFTHNVTPSEEQVLTHEAPLHAIWGRLKEAFAPLREIRLVSRSQILDFADGDRCRYKVRVHMGPHTIFPLEEITIDGKLDATWVYALRGDGPPLSLHPIMLVQHSPEAGRLEMYCARTLAFEKGKKVEALGIASAGKAKVAVP